MNQHLDRAREYIAQGEDFYRKAADEIQATRDEGWTVAAISREIGRSRKWIDDLLAWASKCEGSRTPTPYSGAEISQAKDDEKVRRAARERPDVIADAIKQAPPEAKRDFLRAIADDETIGSAAIEHEHLDRKFPDATPEQRRARPRPGESTHRHIGDRLFKAKYELGRTGEMLANPDIVIDDPTRALAVEMLGQIQDMAAHLRSVVEGHEQFDRDVEAWLNA